MTTKFTAEEQAQFLKDLADTPLDSDSELEDSFFEQEKKRMESEMRNLSTHQDWSIIQQLKRNVKEEDDMITEYEKDREELHKITSNEEKNVIDQNTIIAIKQKVAGASNNSVLTLADQAYNQSVVNQEQHDFIEPNKSFLKVKATASKKVQDEEALILGKLELASQQREYLDMEQEDKLSYKYEMECLSHLFKDRFLRPVFPLVKEHEAPIQIAFTKLPPSFVRLVPQKVSEQTVLPKNAPEIAMKYLKQLKRKNLKSSASVEVKVNKKKVNKQVQQFQDLQTGSKVAVPTVFPIEKMFSDYLSNIKSSVIELQRIADSYHPKFLRYLQEGEKSFNYEYQEPNGKERNITHMASLQNSSSLCQLKLSFQKMTSLEGIEHFSNLEEAQFQFNLLTSLQSLQTCTKLIQLNISYNKIKSLDPLNSLSWLRFLNVEHNSLQSLNLNCKSLQVLIAGNNRIEEIDLNGLPQLRLLQLQSNRLHEIPHLKLPGLEELNLSHNQLSDIKGVEQLILLKKMDLSCNRITAIDQLTFLYLNELNLAGNRLTEINNLFLPCLQEFRVNENKLTNKGSGVAFLPNLKEINIDDNSLEGFGCLWWLLRFSKGAEIVRYGNNEYFLSLREKVREVYESLLYKQFPALKILNDGPTDKGIAQYYRQNYSIYFDDSSFFCESGPSLTKIEATIRLLLRESTFSRVLEDKSDPFAHEQTYIDYQWKCKVASLKEVIGLSQNNERPLIVPPTLFHKYDSHQVARRTLYHQLRGLVLARVMRRNRKLKHFVKLKPSIVTLIDTLKAEYVKSQKQKSVGKFKKLTQGLNEGQAATKIQKVWKGYIRRKIYRKLKSVHKSGSDSDFEGLDEDIGFFDKQLEKVEFDIDLEGFEDIIIRPEVFELLQAKQQEKTTKVSKENKHGQKKEDNGPMRNNFLESRTKLDQTKKQDEAEKLMREWRIKDPRVLKALQYKQQKRDQVKRKQLQKMMTAAERYERFKKSGF